MWDLLRPAVLKTERAEYSRIAILEYMHKQAWENWHWHQVHKTSEISEKLGKHILPFKKKKKTDLQVFSQIAKSMRRLQWIPNTFMDTSLFFLLFFQVYMSDDIKTSLSTHELGNNWLPLLEHVRDVQFRALQTSMMALCN